MAKFNFGENWQLAFKQFDIRLPMIAKLNILV